MLEPVAGNFLQDGKVSEVPVVWAYMTNLIQWVDMGNDIGTFRNIMTFTRFQNNKIKITVEEDANCVALWPPCASCDVPETDAVPTEPVPLG